MNLEEILDNIILKIESSKELSISIGSAAAAIIIIFIVLIINKIIAAISMKKRNKIFEYCVIGGGIAGLTAGYKFSLGGSEVCIIEKDNRLGGRALQFKWHGTEIKMGAGVIRDGDINLRNLLEELDLKVNKFVSAAESTRRATGKKLPTTAERDKFVAFMKDFIQKNEPGPAETISEYLDSGRGSSDEQSILKEIKILIENNIGYHDFKNTSVLDFIFNYPMSDMFTSDNIIPSYSIGNNDIGSESYSGWNALIEKLREKILGYSGEIHLNNEVRKIGKNKKGYYEILTSKRIFNAAKIIIATDLSFYNKDDLPGVNIGKKIVNEIGTVSFARGYSYYKVPVQAAKLADVILVDAINNMIIPFKGEGGAADVIMSVYADSEKADELVKYYSTKNKNFIMKKVDEAAMMITGRKSNDFIFKYWPIGIHYYKLNVSCKSITLPFGEKCSLINNGYRQMRRSYNKKYLMNPFPNENIFVCGEMVGISQGWVEGAIESVVMLEELLIDINRY
jgi:hypothetical protein